MLLQVCNINSTKGRFIVGRSVGRASDARPIWRVIAAITPMRRRMRYCSETLEILEIPLQYDSL